MSKFKVGDRVRFKCAFEEYAEGQEAVVAWANDKGELNLVGDNDMWDAECLGYNAELAPSPDPVNHPAHYQSASGIECIDAIRAALTTEEFRGYCKGNAIKYVWRERMKGGDESLGKAEWYLREAVR